VRGGCPDRDDRGVRGCGYSGIKNVHLSQNECIYFWQRVVPHPFFVKNRRLLPLVSGGHSSIFLSSGGPPNSFLFCAIRPPCLSGTQEGKCPGFPVHVHVGDDRWQLPRIGVWRGYHRRVMSALTLPPCP
jgi:hypothetical protein